MTGSAGAARAGARSGAAAWHREADVAVIGSGAAGISVALTAAARGLRVLVVTKDLVGGATPLAQGGLAAAIGAGDTPAAHGSDTLVAGAGLCEPDVVAALADGAPGAIDWLTGLGARLETRDLRLEGGHSARRIVHSGDDATGAEVHRALLAALLASGIAILDRTVALDLLVSAPDADDRPARGTGAGGPHKTARGTGPGGTDGAGTGTGARARTGTAAANADLVARPVRRLVPAPSVTGLAAAFIGADGRLVPGVISARAVVIAAGGLGQAFGTTSNPAGATGDGIAAAARAGAVIRDLEFVQFHPTVLWQPGASGQCPLVTEALRGAGAVLRDLGGTPLMAGHDPRGDLAPRDVVAARMAEVIGRGSADAGHVWLDATGLGRDLLEDGFPTVTAACRKHGIDPVTEMIPVAPGAHYSCGGILADLDGRTSLPGLYAAGEAASTGVQGANRLASNSVTEAVIAGRRAGAAIAGSLSAAPGRAAPSPFFGSVAVPGETAAAVAAVTPACAAPLAGADTARATPACAAPAARGGALALAAPSLAAPSLAAVLSAAAKPERAAGRVPAGRQVPAGGHAGKLAAAAPDGQSVAGEAACILALAAQSAGDGDAGESAAAGAGAQRLALARSMSLYAGVMRDSGGLTRLLRQIIEAGEPSGPLAPVASLAAVDGEAEPGGLDLESVEAANLRVVSLLIVAGARRRAESRGCHRRRDAAATATVPSHTLARWDGRRLTITREPL